MNFDKLPYNAHKICFFSIDRGAVETLKRVHQQRLFIVV
jgi:hypothetical protein